MDVFEAVADPTRRRLLDLLAVEAMPATSIAGRFPISQPAVSQHLRVLREAGLVEAFGSPADRRIRLYKVNPSPLIEMGRWLQPFWQGQLDSFAWFVEEQS